MKITKHSLFGLLAAGLLSLSAQAETVRLANGDWAPYMAENLKEAGVISHIVKEAFALEGIQVEYQFLPWKRGYEEAKNAKLNGSIIWSHTDERAQEFNYSDSVIDLKTLFFTKKGSGFDWSDKASLAGKRIGGVIGYSYDLEDEEKAGKVQVTRIATPEGNYKKLIDGRIDVVAEDEEVGWELVNQLGYADQIETHPKPLKAKSYHLILNKKQPENQKLMEAFNRGLQKLRESGKYDEYIATSRRGEYKK